jgi:hypothetical protein
MEGSTELRKLPPGDVFGLVHILETGGAWKKLMAVVPHNGVESDGCFVPKYKMEHIKYVFMGYAIMCSRSMPYKRKG